MTRTPLASILFLAAALAGCGDDSNPAEPDAEPGPPDAAEPPDGAESCSARTQPQDPDLAALLDWIEANMDDGATVNGGPVPGVAVAIVRGGEIDELGLLGVKEYGVCGPITEDTRFRMTPLTQTFTDAAVLSAVDDGQLDLDAPITEYVSLELGSGDPAAITLGDLLLHRAGWPRVPGSMCMDGTIAAWFGTYGAQTSLWFPPGTAYSYSQHGHSLVGWVLETLDGTFRESMQQRLFGPLGATATYDLAAVLAGDHAEGHYVQTPSVIPQETCAALEPTGSLYASVRDVASFVRMILRGGDGVLSADAVARMLTDQGDAFYPAWKLTHGMIRVPYHGVDTFWANGWGYGYTVEIVMVPSRDFGFVMLSNRQTAFLPATPSRREPGLVGQKALELFLDLPAYAWSTNTTDPATWTEYVGTYVDPLGVGQGPRTIEVTLDGTTLSATLADVTFTLEPSYPNVEHGPDVFTGVFLGQRLTMRFWRDAGGEVLALASGYGESGPPAYKQ